MKYIEFKEKVMGEASALGLTEYELYASEAESIEVEVLDHDIKTFSTSIKTGACFRCIHEDRIGYAATELYTAEEAERIVAAAMENALVIENNDSVYIQEAGDTYAKVMPVITVEPSTAQLKEFALKMQEACYMQDSHVQDGTQSIAEFDRQTISLCNSKGLDLTNTSAYTIAGVFSIVKEGEEMYSGSKLTAGDFQTLDAMTVGAEAAKDGVEQIGADTLPTGQYTVCFSNKMTAALLSTFLPVFSAEAAQKGLSLLGGKEGEIIASPLVTLVDDPLRKESLVRIPFDSEGVATKRKEVLKEGKLNTLLHNLSTAHIAGVCSTGNGVKADYASTVSILPYNFYVEQGGAGTKEDIFAQIADGVYITELNGLHAGANAATGDFSLSSNGFLIQGGKQGRPLMNFTVSGNFYQLLKDISMVGDDLDFQIPKGTTCFGGPSIVVPDMAIAGK